jgi:hypothetical protein
MLEPVTNTRPALATVARLAAFSAIWFALLAVRMIYRDDPRWALKLGLFAALLLPAVLVIWLGQWATRYRIPWPVELFAVPLVAIAFGYAAVVARNAMRGM